MTLVNSDRYMSVWGERKGLKSKLTERRDQAKPDDIRYDYWRVQLISLELVEDGNKKDKERALFASLSTTVSRRQ